MRQLPRPTPRGWCVLCAAVALVIGGSAVGFIDLVRAGSFGLALLVGAAGLLLLAQPHLACRRTADPTPLECGTPCTITLHVTASRTLQRTLTLTEDQELMQGSTPRWVTILRGRSLLTYETVPTRRGRRRAGPLHVRTHDPLGLMHRETVSRDVATWLVRPRVVPASRSDAVGRGHGEKTRPSLTPRASGQASGSIRAYVVGDDMRTVHWPATAHRGQLMVRQFDPEARVATHLVLGGHEHSVRGQNDSLDEVWETLVTLTASACTHLSRRAQPFSVDVGTERLHSLEAALDALATVATSRPGPTPNGPVLFLHRGDAVPATRPPARDPAVVLMVVPAGEQSKVAEATRRGWHVVTVTMPKVGMPDPNELSASLDEALTVLGATS